MRSRYYPGNPNAAQGILWAYSYDPQGSLAGRHNPTEYGSNSPSPTDDAAFFEAYGSLRQDYGFYSVAPGHAATHRDPVGFGGQFGNYTDTETNLLCLTHRYYDPGTGRFVNRDPIGYAGGINLYGYAGNNPVNERDPSGLAPGPFVPKNDIGESFGPSPTRPKSTLEQLLEARPDLRHMQIMPGDYGAAGMGGASVGIGAAALAAKGAQRGLGRAEAFNLAKDRAGIPRSASPIRQWTVGNDVKRLRTGNYRFSEDLGTHGRYYEYDTQNGKRVIAEHEYSGDPSHVYRPHFHAGQPKIDPTRAGVDFQNERYDEVGGKHHIHYQP